jgi:signal transduction histidine kinase/ActR/RegA family two-component response regulator
MANAALVRSLTLTLALVLALLLFGVALVWGFSGRIARAIDSLARAAQALGRGAPVARSNTGLSEIDAVGSTLQCASSRLKQREEELRGLNETLESRVEERTRELEAATERLAQARKLEAIGRLTGGVAHDFNNLLAIMIGNLDLLAARLKDEKLSRLAANARSAADRGAELTRQLLAFGRRQRMDPQPLELNELIRSAGGLLGSALGPAVVVRCQPGSEPVWVLADREQLEMVIMNLALNARDAMPEGGEVTLASGRATVAAQLGGAEAPPSGDFGVLTVCDTGVGMEPEVLAQIWEPFFSTKPHGAGSGLGLSQVLGVVQQLGGGATVETEPGRGTCFQVYLPYAEPAATLARVETIAVSPAAVAKDDVLKGRRVMLVDDDAGVRTVVAELLRDLGCEVEGLPDGAQALARLEAGDRPDVLVTDYAMPGMTGAEAARRSRERCPDLPVLLISGYLDAEALKRSWNGAVLTKPFSKEALAAHLTRALQRRAAVDRSVA